MKLHITKELLSEVFGKECEVIKVCLDVRYLSCYMRIDGFRQPFDINIYELAHKCKEWAFEKEYTISSEYIPKGDFTSSWAKVHDWLSDDDEYLFKCNGDTEPESIFKACQWILENKENR